MRMLYFAMYGFFNKIVYFYRCSEGVLVLFATSKAYIFICYFLLLVSLLKNMQ